MARLGLDDAKKSDSSSRKKRYIEKMMVAELHHMQGELSVEKSALQQENESLKQAILQLKKMQANGGHQTGVAEQFTSQER